MFTQAFKDAIISALKRNLPDMTAEEISSHLTDDDTLLSMCRIIEYNEKVPDSAQSAQDKAYLFGKPHAIPESLTEYREKANAAMNNYVGYRTAFRDCSPNASSIIRIALGLHMTVEEINSALLSYDLQTISWHRVDDMLLRYAVSKNWPYHTFDMALNAYRAYRDETGALHVAPSEASDAKLMSDSAYVTRMNMSRFYAIIAESDADIAVTFKKLHALFSDAERSSSGAPRRAFLRTIRFTQSGFPFSDLISEDDEEEEDFSDLPARFRREKLPSCPPGKAQASYYLMHEAAGMAPPPAMPADAHQTVNRLIDAIDDLLNCKDSSSLKPVKEPDNAWNEAAQRKYQAEMLEARRKRTLTPATIRDEASCGMILRAVSRDLPQNTRLAPYPSASPEERRLRQMIDLASIVQRPMDESTLAKSCRSSLFRLLLCCGCGKARRLLDETVMQILRCMGVTVLSAAPKENTPAAQAMALAKALQYTPDQLSRLKASLSQLNDSAIKAFTRNVLAPQYVTERYVKDQLSAILDIFDPKRRNSEPSRSFLMLLAFYTFGYAVREDPRAFKRVQAQRYVQQCLKSAWDVSFLGMESKDVLSQTIEQLIESTFVIQAEMPSDGTPLAEKWVFALTKACAAYRTAARSDELTLLDRCILTRRIKDVHTLTCSNPLFAGKLVSGGWEY